MFIAVYILYKAQSFYPRGTVENELIPNMVNFQSTKDFEQQAELLQGWNQGYSQLSPGSFEGYVSELRFDDVHLFIEYSSQSLLQNGCLADDVIAVGMPLQFDGNGLFCGASCDHQSMHIFSGKSGFEFYSPTQLVMAVISVKRDTLLATLNAEDAEHVLQHLSKAKLIQLDSVISNTVREFMTGIFTTIQQHPQLLKSVRQRAQLSQTIMSLLVECLTDGKKTSAKALDCSAMTSARCRDIIAETRNMVHKNADTPISVAEVCFQLGVSRRTLQYCFQNLLDTTPMAFLRAERLNGVRRMLRTEISVTEAAAHWGFWHFGHFAHEYKKMFGELPSVTSKRRENH